ncbi:hypothetical protein JR334_05085 [Clostridia bacterium]|nr:hypothetical protein JR334_05085 [Clostridia bacterium]
MKQYIHKKSTDLVKLEAHITRMNRGVVVAIGGGDSHIGTLILAEPRTSLTGDGSISATSSVFNRIGHLDEAPLRKNAEILAATLNQPVVVTGGIHLERIDKDSIVKIIDTCDLFFKEILQILGN